MIDRLRTIVFALLAATAVAACSSPSPQEQVQTTELTQLDTLKKTYDGIVMGFDFKGDTTLLVSLDIQNYIGIDDDTAAKMKTDVLAHWKSAWIAAHPGKHATVTARMIDFVGRKIWEGSAKT
jgi:hypothetical protein